MMFDCVKFGGSEVLRLDLDHGLLGHPKYRDLIRSLTIPCVGQNLITGRISWNRPIILPNERVFDQKISFIGEQWDHYYTGQNCSECEGTPTTATLLRRSSFLGEHLPEDHNAAYDIAHKIGHLGLNLLLIAAAQERIDPADYLERVSETPDAEQEFAYATFRWFYTFSTRAVGTFGERLTIAAALVTAFIEDDPVAERFSTDHWQRIASGLAPINIYRAPYRFLFGDPLPKKYRIAAPTM